MIKTDIWIYTIRYGDQLWQGVFDCEVSMARVESVFREETDYPGSCPTIMEKRRTFFRQTRDTLSTIPEMSRYAWNSLEQDLRDPKWLAGVLDRITLDQPVLAEYLLRVKDISGPGAALVGAIVYRLIESQIEADQV